MWPPALLRCFPWKSAADRAVSSANVTTGSLGSAGKQVPWKPPLKIELWLSPEEEGAFPPTPFPRGVLRSLFAGEKRSSDTAQMEPRTWSLLRGDPRLQQGTGRAQLSCCYLPISFKADDPFYGLP